MKQEVGKKANEEISCSYFLFTSYFLGPIA
jgi:hypothetical protein